MMEFDKETLKRHAKFFYLENEELMSKVTGLCQDYKALRYAAMLDIDRLQVEVQLKDELLATLQEIVWSLRQREHTRVT